jgi:hypothetical protein
LFGLVLAEKLALESCITPGSLSSHVGLDSVLGLTFFPLLLLFVSLPPPLLLFPFALLLLEPPLLCFALFP